MTDKPASAHQHPSKGKVENDCNKTGNKAPTQLNQGKRTPESRNDREAQGPGPNNPGAGRTAGNACGTARGAG